MIVRVLRLAAPQERSRLPGAGERDVRPGPGLLEIRQGFGARSRPAAFRVEERDLAVQVLVRMFPGRRQEDFEGLVGPILHLELTGAVDRVRDVH